MEERGLAHFHLMFFFLWLWEKFNFAIIWLFFFFFWNNQGSLVHLTSALFQTFEPSTVQMSPLGSRRTRASRWFLENIWFDFSREGCLRVTLSTCPVILWQFRKQKGEITFLKRTNGDGFSMVPFQVFLSFNVLFCFCDFSGLRVGSFRRRNPSASTVFQLIRTNRCSHHGIVLDFMFKQVPMQSFTSAMLNLSKQVKAPKIVLVG